MKGDDNGEVDDDDNQRRRRRNYEGGIEARGYADQELYAVFFCPWRIYPPGTMG